jgi:uncharacterized protein involved in exopolysaccharide biosynthesis
MRRWIGRAARLYPHAWRERYGEEFAALLEDHNAGWRELTDVVGGAFRMQMIRAAAYWKLAGGITIAAVVAATAISFRIPPVFKSTAMIRVTPGRAAGGSIEERAHYHLTAMEQTILSRTSLVELITHLDLYQRERAQEPMEDIVERMRKTDIAIQMVDSRPVFTVSFSYPEREKAQAAVQALAKNFVSENENVNRMNASLWRTVWPPASTPPDMALEVLDPASLPQKPESLSHAQFAAVGLGIGLALAMVTIFAIHAPKWALGTAGCAAIVCGLGTAAVWLAPASYTSRAVLRLAPPVVPSSLTREVPAAPAAETVQRVVEVVLSRFSLEGIITDPKLDLYPQRRVGVPMEDVIAAMRRAIRIRFLQPSGSTFEVSFTYPDGEKAQAVVRVLVARFTEQSSAEDWNQARLSGNPKAIEISEHKLGRAIQVMDPPSDPETPASRNRAIVSIAGLALGALLGVVACRPRQPRLLAAL